MEQIFEILQHWDVQLMYIFNVAARNPLFDWLMPLFYSGRPWRIPLILFILALLIFGGKRVRLACAGAVLVVIGTDQISSQLIKPLVERVRPCNVLGSIYLWRHGSWMMTPDPVVEVYKNSLSFPSSHAANSGGQAFWWAWTFPRYRWVAYGVAFTVGYSRVYDGVHYPFDVVAGWGVGGLVFAVLWLVVKRFGPVGILQPGRMAISTESTSEIEPNDPGQASQNKSRPDSRPTAR